MQKFTKLYCRLFHAQQETTKRELLINYFTTTPDPERGYALAILAHSLTMPKLTTVQLRQLITEKIDPKLFEFSYQYVGDLAETIALLWPLTQANNFSLPTLSQLVVKLQQLTKQDLPTYLLELLANSDPDERWVLLKLLTGKLALNLTTRTIKQTLAIMGHTSVHAMEAVWRYQQPPYQELFAWLSGTAAKPLISDIPGYMPVMLANPITITELKNLDLANYQIEWNWDGTRVQVISQGNYQAIFNRAGDDLSGLFPEIVSRLNFEGILDGELLSNSGNMLHLQHRLKRHKPSPKLIKDYPVHLQLFDALTLNNKDLRKLSLNERRLKLAQWHEKHQPANIFLSEAINSADLSQLTELLYSQRPNVAGLFFKSLASPYIAGRSHSHWYRLKRDPYVVDAVLMYAQRGQGRYANFYSEYTLGLWQDRQLLPIGKPYVEISAQEILQIDNWVKNHTVNRFGPVRAVVPNLVFELAFDAVHLSNRHVAGFTLHFPRINRVRWDKSALEAGQLSSLQYYIAD
jgi:DNA ligase-1